MAEDTYFCRRRKDEIFAFPYPHLSAAGRGNSVMMLAREFAVHRMLTLLSRIWVGSPVQFSPRCVDGSLPT